MDLFEALGGTKYLSLLNQTTDNFASELVGKWRIINRQPVYSWGSYDLDKELNDFELVDIKANRSYDFPTFQNNKNHGDYRWRALKKCGEYYLCAELNPYSYGNDTYHIWDKDRILYNDGNVIVSQRRILVRESEVINYKTLKNLIGYISSLLILAYDRIYYHRKELLKKCDNSCDKANEYMRLHNNELLYSLMPRFETFKHKLFGWIDIFKDSPQYDGDCNEIELEIVENYVNTWVIKSRKKFSQNELSMIDSATIVRSHYPDGRDAGKSVHIKLKNGGNVFFKLSESSKLEEGDRIDLENAEILTLGKDREVTRYEIEA